MNAQVTRFFFNKFEVYIGGENLSNFLGNQIPILGFGRPFGENFDTSIVYAPIMR
jgi:hypothetical protein